MSAMDWVQIAFVGVVVIIGLIGFIKAATKNDQ